MLTTPNCQDVRFGSPAGASLPPSRPDARTIAALCVGTLGGEYGGGLREDTLGETTLRAEKGDAALRYELEMKSRKVGWGDPTLVYDEQKDLFRFRDGRFAFSREHADWELLRKRGWMKRL